MSLTHSLKKHWLTLTLLFILVLITYGNSLNNVFLSDDLADIVQNPKIGDFKNIINYPGFLRPLLYWFAYTIGGLSPFLFRSVNIFFHIGTVFSVYILFNLISSRKLAIIIASLFAVHPAISEAVVWISGGMYSQYAFFFMLSFIFYILSKNSKKYYLISIVSFYLTFMSHPQMPVSLFLIFPLWELTFGNLKKNWAKTIPYLFLSIAFIFVAVSALPEREATLQSIHYQQRGVDNPFILIPIALTSYFELIFFPNSLTLYHSELASGQIQFAIRFLLTLIFFVITLICFKRNKFIFFWSSFFLIALAPTLTPFRLNWIVAERYLYLPIVGILALAALGFDKISQHLKFKQATYILISLMIIVLSGRTIIRNIDWKNEDNLWIATGKTSPSSPNTHNNLGDVYGRHGDKEGALREFQKAIELKPNYGDAYHNLANTYNELGNLDKALENYQNALKFNPNLWQSYQNIASIYFVQARQATSSAELSQKYYNLTLENVQKALAINPKNINLRANLGIIYLLMGQKEQAKQVFQLILSIDPQNQAAKAGLVEANK